MTLKKLECTPESGSVDTYVMQILVVVLFAKLSHNYKN